MHFRWTSVFLCLVACSRPTPSETSSIIGHDDRKNTSAFKEYVGSFAADGIPQCTGFALADGRVLTAAHCLSEEPRSYSFHLSNGESYPISRIEHLNRRADVAILRAGVKEGLTQGPYHSGATVEMISYDLHRFGLVSNEGYESQEDAGLVYHTLDSVDGASGSPLIQDGQVVGIHIGSLPDANKNLAVSLEHLDIASIETLEFLPERGLRIPRRIGGTIGEVIGTVTNPLRDAVTRPVSDILSQLNSGAMSLGGRTFPIGDPVKRAIGQVLSNADLGKDAATVLTAISLVANGVACIASEGAAPCAPDKSSAAASSTNACVCAVLSATYLLQQESDKTNSDSEQEQQILTSAKFNEILARPGIEDSINKAISAFGVGR